MASARKRANAGPAASAKVRFDGAYTFVDEASGAEVPRPVKPRPGLTPPPLPGDSDTSDFEDHINGTGRYAPGGNGPDLAGLGRQMAGLDLPPAPETECP